MRRLTRVALPLRGRASFIPPRRTFAASPSRPWSTPLAKQLTEAITTTGPVPLASYMRMCLTGDLGGYYGAAASSSSLASSSASVETSSFENSSASTASTATDTHSDITDAASTSSSSSSSAIFGSRARFGARGDFITSPEISQIFGELIGLWLVAEWISQGSSPQGVQLFELGPGRGTLMDDVLRTIARFPKMAAAIESAFMVEAAPDLRDAQKLLLCGADAPCTDSRVGRHSTSARLGVPIVWTETVRSIPIEADKMPLMVAHEFFDALPIHAFQSAPSSAKPPISGSPPTMEWREMLVGTVGPADATPRSTSSKPDDAPPEFQLVLSSTPTRHSRHLPESSPRYRRLRHGPAGSLIEICPDASLHAADMAARIGGSAKHPKPRPSGAALVIDYGPADTVPINSLRGIRDHRLVSPFSSPGRVDLSADVDFAAIAEATARASPSVEIHGPVAQADFLACMGIRERADMLAMTAATPAAAADLHRACARLVDRGLNGMGKLYKAMAILPENDGRRRPVGFGGDVASS